MKSMISKRSRSILTVSLASLLLASCTTTEGKLSAALSASGQAGLVDQAIASGALPEYPPYCRHTEHSGVVSADRLDVALLKTDRALGRANGRIEACARWYDQNMKARNTPKS